ncbi:FAD-dependent oxidoreductase [Methylobacterium aquaticum]|uniref:FAD-dependent oxidoreductase n=1 Tax=Methylobacterium aquaticum TaxID=270351 RepID=UPI003D185967
MPVTLSMSDGAAILVVDNPPLNLLDKDIRAKLLAAMDEAVALGAERLIVTGQGRAFVAGADAREFDGLPQEPHLNEVLNRLVHLPLPTIAAINGAALGGGLEIALACRYRIAAPSAAMALPEVTLGIVPGAGGTQRLPRLIGVGAALELIVGGKTVVGDRALALGLVDRIAEDTVAEALALDRGILDRAVVPDLRPAPAADEAAVSAMQAQVRRRMPGQIAPSIAVELVAASATAPLDSNLARERTAFLQLRASDQARALRHVFFAERTAANRGRDFPKPTRDITSAIVVGGGNMGAAIAYALASAKLAVTVVERDQSAVERAASNLRGLVDQGVARGTLTAEQGEALGARISCQIGYSGLPPADLAIEAAFEDLAVKQEIFAELERALPADTILATNTSYLDVNRLAEGVADPGRVLGLHFFSPAHIMKLLEIVRAERTAQETLGAAFALARLLGKIPVLSGVCDGFIGNRILTRYRLEADLLLAEGALPQEVDAAMREFGMAMGPYEAQDMSGLDIAYANRKRQGSVAQRVPLVERLVEDHRRLGRKTAAGWYDYNAEGKPVTSSLVTEAIQNASAVAGLARQKFEAHDIVERCTLAMIAEACAILDEGIAENAADIDLVLIHGYGFPRWRGGLMHYAACLNRKTALGRYKALANSDPTRWPVPSQLFGLLEIGIHPRRTSA